MTNWKRTTFPHRSEGAWRIIGPARRNYSGTEQVNFYASISSNKLNLLSDYLILSVFCHLSGNNSVASLIINSFLSVMCKMDPHFFAFCDF